MSNLNFKEEIWHKSIVDQFPILSRQKNWIYLDNAATTQKPIRVIKAIEEYYSTINSNVHRGVHAMSQKSTYAMEESRKKIQKFINAKHPHEIIFTKGTTDSINLLASSMEDFISEGDEILLSNWEHHSNIIPWQMLCKKTKAILKIIPIDKEGNWKYEDFESLLSSKTKVLAISHISNATGILSPIKEMTRKAHDFEILVAVDGAQALSHKRIDVEELEVDFYSFSAHKMYGPSGVGVLYGKENLLEKLSPYQGGGGMIKEVSFEKTTYADLPFKFEAGTPNLSAIVALGKAIEFIEEIGLEKIEPYEKKLLEYASGKLSQIEGIKIYGKEMERSGIISFNLKGLHPFDVGSVLDRLGIAIRTGHHCAQPLMKTLETPGTLRASLAIYNTTREMDALYEGILKAKKMLL